MQPIHELLSRIRWDPEFARGTFELTYVDHQVDQLIRVGLDEARFENGNHFSFQLLAADGVYRDIPFHRVRGVYKNGALIWERPPAKGE